MSGRIIYVGNLPLDIKEWEIEDLFFKYGKIVNIDLKLPPRPPGYAFVEFEDGRDAMDAVKGRDRYEAFGEQLRVEISHGGGRRGGNPIGGGRREMEGAYRGGAGGGYPRSRGAGAGSYGVSRRTDYRTIVSGLPNSCSWQDLKDHMRKGGEVTFAQVMRDRDGMIGLVDYSTYEDMKHAISRLDDTEFRNPFDKGYIRVREDRGRGGRRSPHSRSYSRSRSRSRSVSRPRKASRSVSRSKSASPRRSRSRSRSKSFEKVKEEKKPSLSLSPIKKEESPNGHVKSPSRSVSPRRSRSRSPQSQ